MSSNAASAPLPDGRDLRFFDDQQRAVGVFQIGRLADQAGHRAIELRQQLLAHRPLAVERFLVPAGLVEPDQRPRQVDEGDAVARRRPARPPAADR